MDELGLSLIYDIIVVLIIVSLIYSGNRRGLMRMVLSLTVYVIAFAVSSTVSDKFSEPVYMEYVRPRIVSALSGYSEELREKILESFDIDDISTESESFEEINISDKFPEIVKIIEDNIMEISDRYGIDEFEIDSSDDKLKETIVDGVIGDDTEKIAEYIEENIVRKTVVRAVEYLLWSVMFTLITAMGKTVMRIFLSVRHFGAIKRFDNTLGGILGFIQGIVIIYAAVIFLKLIIGLTGNIGIISEETIADTLIFKYFYDFVSL